MRTPDIFPGPGDPETILSVCGLRTVFFSHGQLVRVLGDVGFRVERGQAVALIGMSGSGKSVSVLSAFGLVRANPGVVAGQSWFKGVNALAVLMGR